MTRRLKLSPDGVKSVIDIIMSDEKLVGYVLALVSKRLTVEMREDSDWCNQVVDYCIEQVLQDVNIVELVENISVKAPSTIKDGSKGTRKDKKQASPVVEPEELITPPFSSTEPHSVSTASPRRVVKALNKNKNVELPPSSGVQALKRALLGKAEMERSMSVESTASTVPVVDSYNDGVIISTNAHAKRENSWPVGQIESVRSESSISSTADTDLYVSVLDSEAQASFRDENSEIFEQGDARSYLPQVVGNSSPEASSETGSLDGTAPTPPRHNSKVPVPTAAATASAAAVTKPVSQTRFDNRAQEATLGGKNHAVGSKVYKVPFKPTTFDGKPKAFPETTTSSSSVPAATPAAAPPVVVAAAAPSSVLVQREVAPVLPVIQAVAPFANVAAIAPVTPPPASPGHTVQDEDFLTSWEKQVLQGMKNGEESDGEETSVTPRASFENSFVSQLARSPSKTPSGDLDQYELYSQQSESDSPEPTRPVDSPEELNVIPSPTGSGSGSGPLQKERTHSESAESDLTDPTLDSPRAMQNASAHSSRTHHQHHHHHHHYHRSTTNEDGGDEDKHVHQNDGIEDEDEDEHYSSDSASSSSSSSSADSESEASDDEEPDYLRAPPLQQSGQLLFFDQSRFDADADYFAAESNSGKKKSPPKRKSAMGAKKKNSDSTAAGAAELHVKFAPRLISEVHYRDRVGYHEKAELFFTHNEEYQFTMDQSKEAERAEALGMTWMEWMEQRTDEDVQREEAEYDSLNDFKLYSGEYYEEDEEHHHSGGGSSSQVSYSINSFNSAPSDGHDFKAGNAHVSPVIAHSHPTTHVLTTQQVLATHSNNNNNNNNNNNKPAGKSVLDSMFSDDLSVPSCSSDDNEYDFDNF